MSMNELHELLSSLQQNSVYVYVVFANILIISIRCMHNIFRFMYVVKFKN